MFSKESDLLERTSTLMKEKEVKKLKSNLLSHFPSIDESELTDFIGKKRVHQVRLNNRLIVYRCEGVALAVQCESESLNLPPLMPTLPLLWRFPLALPSCVVHPPVSRFLLRGATLMLPGIVALNDPARAEVPGFPALKGSLIAVRVAGNPMPFAVGVTLVSGQNLIAYGLKGKGVDIKHIYNDFLCSPSKGISKDVIRGGDRDFLGPNKGFSPEVISPISGFVDPYTGKVSSEEDDEEDDEKNNEEDKDKYSGANDNQDKDILIEENELKKEENEENTIVEEEEELLNDVEGLKINEVESSPQVMDELIIVCFLRCVKYIINKNDFPILLSSLWPLVIKCTIENESDINLKKSSFQRVSDFVKKLNRQTETNFIEMKEEENGVQSIISVKEKHDLWKKYNLNISNPPLFRSHVRGEVEGKYNNNLNNENCKDEEEENVGEVDIFKLVNDGNSSINDNRNKKFESLSLYKVPKRFMIDFLNDKKGEFGLYLRSGEIKIFLNDYFNLLETKVENSSDEINNINNKSQLTIFKTDVSDHFFRFCEKLSSIKSEETQNKKENKVEISEMKSKFDIDENFDDENAENENELNSDDEYEMILKQKKEGNNNLNNFSGGVLVESVDSLLKKNNSKQTQSKNSNSNSNSKQNTVSKGIDFSGFSGKPVSLPPSQKIVHQTIRNERSEKREKKLKNNILPSEEVLSVVVKKEDLYKNIVSKLTLYNAIISPHGEVIIQTGKSSTISLSVKSFAANRIMTIVKGLTDFRIDLSQIAVDFRKRFACSVSVTEDSALNVQGRFVKEIESLLVATYGIPKHLIIVEAQKSKK